MISNNEKHEIEAGEIRSFSLEYFELLSDAYKKIKLTDLEAVCNLLSDSYENNRRVYVIGNGGSSSIANHLVCDHLKGISEQTNLKPFVYSCTTSTELITAIGNDLSFEEIFSFQISKLCRVDDILLAVSSSGNSENIIRAVHKAKEIGMLTISFTGFNGGRLRALSDFNVHVPICNYGIVEDTHQSIMHIISQYIRNKNVKRDQGSS